MTTDVVLFCSRTRTATFLPPPMNSELLERDEQVSARLLQAIDEGDFKRLKQWLDHDRVILMLSQSKNDVLVLLHAVACGHYDHVRSTVSNLLGVSYSDNRNETGHNLAAMCSVCPSRSFPLDMAVSSDHTFRFSMLTRSRRKIGHPSY